MKKVNLRKRNVIAIAICLAATTMFASCEQLEEPIDPNDEVYGIDMSDNEYYGTQQTDLEKALRNVHIKYWYQIPDRDTPNNGKMFGEVLSCKGRLWGKGDRLVTSIKNVEQWYGYDKQKYWAYSFNLHEKIEWRGFMGFAPPFETMHNGLMANEPISAIEQYFVLSKTDFWNKEVETGSQGGLTLTKTVNKYNEITVIAGRNCKSYSIHNVYSMYGTVIEENESLRVWYDPETKVTMRVEGHINSSGFPVKFEITEIEYGKVTVNQIDKILENYLLQYPNNQDISNKEDAGAEW